MIAHVVLFEPKPGLSANEKRTFLAQIRSTARISGAVEGAYVGTTIAVSQAPTPEDGQKTYSYSAMLLFSDRQAFERYLSHPAHDDLRAMFWNFCGATFIADMDVVELDDERADLLV